MAKLKIGSGIKMEAQVAEVEQSDYQVDLNDVVVVPVIEKRVPSIEEVMELIQSTQVQHNHAPVEVDLSGLATKEELSNAIVRFFKQRDELEIRIEEINDKLVEKLSAPREIIVPEVINTTHIKDVSPEVLKQCSKMIEHLDLEVSLKISKLEKQNKKQSLIISILSGLAALTLLLHLL